MFSSSWVRLQLKPKDVPATEDVAKWKTYVTIYL